MNFWDWVYNLLGIKDFIVFTSSPVLQDILFPVKIVFILFTAFFICATIYFYVNSSYLQYQFLQDVFEFFSWQSYGFREINKRWRNIVRKTESGLESDFKLAVVEADDFLRQTMQKRGHEGKTFEEMVSNVSKSILPNYQEILDIHNIRNSIVHDPNYKLDKEQAKKILSTYEKTIKNIATS